MTEIAADRGGELVPGLLYKDFVEEAARYPTEASFRASPFFKRYGGDLIALLSTPRIDRVEGASSALASPSAPSKSAPSKSASSKTAPSLSAAPGSAGPPHPIRLVHWNIEKGKALSGLIHELTTVPCLRDASIWCLNEVDHGTIRAGHNADIARELAAALHCNAVYLPSFIECSKGLAEELLVPGENRLGLHGLAILSRFPVLDARMNPLPHCFDYFPFVEKRFGFRQGLYVKLDCGGEPLIVGTTHLEVRRTPRCRAKQIDGFLEGLQAARGAWGEDLPVVVTGDWNTNTFRRGKLWHSALEFLRIVATPAKRLEMELSQPFAREPLFARLERAGLEVRLFNNEIPTVSQDLGSVEDLQALPVSLAWMVVRTFRLPGRVLRMRLDWIAAHGLRPAGAPWTLPDLEYEGKRVSDHAPIGVDLYRKD